jgi:tRNA nucleotidyltransferase (CCA-adding enzyme)
MAMTADQYLNQIITKYQINEAGVKTQVKLIYPTIQRWANRFLVEAIYSGSIAKGTAISLSTDADVFISLSSTTSETLSQIYTTLYNALSQPGYQARKQNVSIGVTSGGYKIDFVPGKRQSQYGYDHSIYMNKKNTWTMTNVKTHVSHVAGSNRIKEVKLTKIWRELNKLDFPSFYLELAVIDHLSGRSYGDLSGNF